MKGQSLVGSSSRECLLCFKDRLDGDLHQFRLQLMYRLLSVAAGSTSPPLMVSDCRGHRHLHDQVVEYSNKKSCLARTYSALKLFLAVWSSPSML